MMGCPSNCGMEDGRQLVDLAEACQVVREGGFVCVLTESCSAARRLHRKNDASGDATEFSPCVPERNCIASPVTFVMGLEEG